MNNKLKIVTAYLVFAVTSFSLNESKLTSTSFSEGGRGIALTSSFNDGGMGFTDGGKEIINKVNEGGMGYDDGGVGFVDGGKNVTNCIDDGGRGLQLNDGGKGISLV